MPKKISAQNFSSRIKDRFPEETFQILSYSGTGNPLSVKCENCGQIITVSKAVNFLAKNKAYGCVNCHGLWRQREKKWDAIKQNYFVEQTDFVSCTHKVYRFTCKKCGTVRTGTMNNILLHPLCRCDGQTNNWTTEELKKVLVDRYEVLDSPSHITDKTKLRCKRCGMIWITRLSDVIYHEMSGCPNCHALEAQSIGAKFVNDCLDEIGIEYEREKRVGDTLMRFDFFIPSKNIAIEYNGAQHYKFVKIYHINNEGFKKHKERDKKKALYCEQNGIKLLVIPYTWKPSHIKNFLLAELGSTTSASARS